MGGAGSAVSEFLAAENRVLLDAYRGFLAGGGNADQFTRRYTDLAKAYFDFLLAGAKVLRLGPAGPPLSAELPAAGAGGPDTRELVYSGSLLLVADGGVTFSVC